MRPNHEAKQINILTRVPSGCIISAYQYKGYDKGIVVGGDLPERDHSVEGPISKLMNQPFSLER